MKTWVVNVGFGAFREGNFEEDENIKIHFGYISGTDHIKSAGQEAHHHETILECGTAEEEPPL
jgi:protein transport protein SEC24